MATPSDSDFEKRKDDTLPDRHAENAAGSTEFVDEMTERKLLRKVDYRIIPMIMWSSSIAVLNCAMILQY